MSVPWQVHRRLPKAFPKEFRHDLYSVEFDGANDQISIPTLNLGGWTGFTAVWRIYWYSDYGESFPRVFDFGNAIHYVYYTIGTLTYTFRLTIAGTSRTLDYNFDPKLRWDMYVLRWESGDFMRLYRNGVQVATSAAAYAGALTATTALPHILGNDNLTTRTLHGRYAHFALYNRALTLGEIYDLARLSYMRLLQGAVCCLPMDEGLGVTAGDVSGSGNNGTLVNGPTWMRNAKWELLAESRL